MRRVLPFGLVFSACVLAVVWHPAGSQAVFDDMQGELFPTPTEG